MKKFAVVFLNLILVLSVICLGRIYMADVYSKKSQVYLSSQNQEQSLFYANKAVKFNPFEPSYYRRRAKVLIVGLINLTSAERSNVKSAALQDMAKAFNLNPANLVTVRDLVPLYYFLSIEDISKPVSYSNVDEEYLKLAKNFYKNIKEEYKDDLGVVVLVAKYEKKLGLTQEYLESTQIIRNLRSDVLEWHPDLVD